ncbi:MotA/TolQ/ExbB proton channel family protein [bacterium]|nr:MotA/TolQ/ExbB proton channel family protein [bacterium]HPF34199.1 MotA/TolQ/ExbB proton channel family protein [Candidatus Krumholzibacteria bacterium]
MLGMTLTELLLGSPTMVVLMICSVITVSFAVERAFYFMRTKADTASFMRELSSKMQGGDLKAAYAWVSKQKHSAGRVCAQCLGQTGAKESDLKQRFNTAIELEQVEMERNLSVLGTMSNIAPLLGLFGTVIGIIRAFADIARTGAGGSAVVAMGVSEALLTTAAGIVVAVIATISFNLYVRRIRTRVIELEDVREEFFSILWQLGAPKRQAAAKAQGGRSAQHLIDAAQDSVREPAHAGQ